MHLMDTLYPPLSFAQQRLWFLHRMEGPSATYNLPMAVRLDGDLDVPALESSVRDLVGRHEVLRTIFPDRDGVPYQRILDARDVRLSLIRARVDGDLHRRLAEFAAHPFDLGVDIPLHSALFEVGPRQHVLVLVVHHIAADGWSMGPLARDLATAYAARRAGVEPHFPDLDVQYADYAVWQRELLGSEDDPESLLSRQLEFWRAALAGAPEALNLPHDHRRGAVTTYQGASEPVWIDPATHRRLAEIARGCGASLFMVLQAGLAILLRRLGAGHDIPIGAVVAGRSEHALEDLVGCFVNTLVLRTDVSGDPGFADVVRRVRAFDLEAFAHQDLPFERLVEELQPARSQSRQPLVQVVLTLQNVPTAAVALPALTITPEPLATSVAKFDLSLSLTEHVGAAGEPLGIGGRLEYCVDLFEQSTAQSLVTRFVRLLGDAAANPDTRLHQLPILGPDERDVVLGRFNATRRDAPPATLPCLIETQAEATPGATAVIFEGTSLSYAELNRAANRLAHVLIHRGIGPESIVGIAVDRSLDLIVALLAVWKAGAAYLPLDPDYPAARIEFMLAQARPAVVVGDEKRSTAVDVGIVPIVDLAAAEIQTELSSSREDNPRDADRTAALDLEHPAYVIYTSGSTGTPKGVVVTHKGIASLAGAQIDTLCLSSRARVLQFASLNFDASLWEVVMALTTGAALVLMRSDARSGAALGEVLTRERITHTLLPPTVLATLAEPPVLPIETLIVGGEACPGEIVERWSRGRRMVNAYGPTESTVCISMFGPLSGPDAPPIGYPVWNTRAYVLDDGLEPLPVGVAGELYVAGSGLARGYLGRPALTAERFLADPYAPAPGQRMYRTGDLARWRVDGALEYLGRADRQVKVRGFRIEPGEIEAVLSEQPDVALAVVVAEGGASGAMRLVAYLEAAPGAVPDPEQLRRQLGARLPDYMVPSTVVVLEKLPLTPSGKVDRAALPNPQDAGANYRAPRTAVERTLCEIFAEVLGVDRIGIDDSFFALGGHSLLAMQIVSRVGAALGVEMRVGTLFDAPTIAELAPRVTGSAPRRPLLEGRPRPPHVPLSPAQQRLWFLHRLEGPSPTYNIPIALRLDGPIDAGAIEAAFRDVVERHESLRTLFRERDGAPFQAIVPAELARPDLCIETVSESTLPERLRHAASACLRLSDDLPLRASLFAIAPDRHVLLLLLHHIAGDGWSIAILARDFAEAYAARGEGRAPDWTPLPVQYADYAMWHRELLGGENEADSLISRQIEHWRGALAGAPDEISLPCDRARPTVPTYRGAGVPIWIEPQLHDRLAALAREEGVSLFVALHAALAALLNKLGAGTDIVIGTVTAGRTERATEDLIGFFVNTLPLRSDLSGDPTFNEVLARARRFAFEAYAHQDAPFEKLVEALQPARSLTRHPIFQVMLTLQNVPRAALSMPGVVVGLEPLPVATARFDLAFDLVERTGAGGRCAGIAGVLAYSLDVFDETTARTIVRRFVTLLESAVSEPRTPLHRLAILDDEERATLVDRFNDTTRASDPRPVPEILEQLAVRSADRPAVMLGSDALTYRQLNARANQLAHALIARGIGPESIVGVAIERSLDLIVALFGVLKAGAAYLPLDVDYPPARQDQIVSDARPALVLRAPDMMRLGEWPDHDPTADERTAPLRLEHPAYVIYTSGTTGVPKGVVVSHAGFVDLGLALGQAAIDAESRMLQFSSISFDASVAEIAVALMAGCTLVLVQRDARGGRRLYDALRSANVTHAILPPVVLPTLAEYGELPLQSLIVAGEACPGELVARWSPGRRMVNAYGPTETTVCATVSAPLSGADPPPIGTPIRNIRVFVLDEALEPVPIGSIGELYVSGAALARGYLRRPALTAERFVASPYGGDGARMYRTGDLVRWRANGVLEFVGRRDQQVKIRGFRVELGEIEAALLVRPEVAQAAVIVRHDHPAPAQIVAYVVGVEAAAIDSDALQRCLAARLPDYMQPSAIVELASLPMTPNGKIDLKALPAPERGSRSRRARSPEERVICEILAEILSVDRVGPDDNFFALGGDSITSILLVSRAARAGIAIAPRDVFQYPTIEALAAAARTGDRAARQWTSGERCGELAPTPIIRWLVERGGPINRFTQSTVVAAPNDLTADALRAIVQALLDTHDALRLEMDGDRCRIRQESAVSADSCISHVDLSSLDGPGRHERMRAEMSLAAGRLDPKDGRVFAAVWFTSDLESFVGVIVHHLAVDSVSWHTLLADLAAAWRAIALGERPALDPEPVPFRVWAQTLSAHAGAAAVVDQLAFWESMLAGSGAFAPGSTLADTDTVATARQLVVSIPREVSAGVLGHVTAAFHARPDEIMLATLSIAVEARRRRRGWRDDSGPVIEVESHGRESFDDELDVTRTVGWFTSLFPVRLRAHDVDIDDALAGGAAIGRAIKQIKEQLRAVPDHGVGYGLLRYCNHETESRLASLPAPQLAFNYLGRVEEGTDDKPWSPARFAGAMQPTFDPGMPLAHWLTVNAVTVDGADGPSLSARWIWAGNRLSDSDVHDLAETWQRALAATVQHAAQPGAGGHSPSDFALVRLTPLQVQSLEALHGAIDDVLPLSPLQEGLIFHSLYDRAAPDVYVVQVVLEFAGTLDSIVLERAAEALLLRHANLRVSVHHHGLARPVQVVPREVHVPWRAVDLRSEADPRPALERLIQADRERRFDLAEGPLIRFTLARLDDDRHVLVVAYHHVLFDGWSTPLVFTELLALYQHGGAADALPPVRPYADFLGWLSRQDNDRAAAAWRTYLTGLEGPVRLSPPAAPAFEPAVSSRFDIDVDAACTSRLVALTRHHSVTLNTMVEAAWAVLLGRLTGRDDVVFGRTVSGRPPDLAGVERMIGLFINTVPVRVRLRAGQTFAALVREIQQSQSDLRDVEHIGLAEIQRLAGVDSLFDILLVFENYPLDRRALSDAASELTIVHAEGRDAAHYPLTIVVAPGERLHVRLDYDPSRISQPDVQAIAARFVRLLEAAAAAPEQLLHRLSMLDGAERSTVLETFNRTAHPTPPGTFPDLFEQQVARTPDAPAVFFDAESLTYAALNVRANQVAHWLIDKGIGTEDVVGIAMRRSIAMVVGVLGVMKAGAAYLALDPDYPGATIAHMVRDAAPALILRDLSAEGIDRSPRHNPSDRERVRVLLPQHPAYVIYTSGSTGTPKGVVLPHAGIPSLAAGHVDNLRLTPDSRVLQFASLNFDGSLWEIVMTLTTGAALVLIDADSRTGELLRHALIANGVTHALLPPVVLGTLDERQDIPLTTLIVGGEACSGSLVARWSERRRMVNAYGPTESTVCATISSPLRGSDEPSIGSPVWNTQVYVLDAALEPQPVGVTGELYVGGSGLARGYLERPALTAERFVANPWSPVPGSRIYRTGDLARWRGDGTLEYRGRADLQVKVRGHRVELGEIEASLLADPSVAQAAVIVRSDLPGGRALVAYLVAATGDSIDTSALRARLATRLPEHMLPSAFVAMAALPMTPNGKVDRTSLPAPQRLATVYRAARTPEEETLCSIFADVLEIERVGVDDDFFALGGHSLLATRVASRVGSELGVDLPLRTIFESPTIEALAARLTSATAARPPLVAQPRPARVPLSYAQQRLWFIDQLEGGSSEYNIPSALRLRGRLDREAVAAAIQAIVARHESLRTHFAEIGGEPAQVIEPSLDVPVRVVDLSSLSDAAQSAAVRAAASSEWNDAFDLSRGPVLRARLLKLGDQDHVLLTTLHHIVSDGWSSGVFQREFVALYEAFTAGRPSPLAPLPIQYADFAIWQRRWLDEAGLRDALAYWTERLTPLPEPLTLPADRARPVDPTYAADLHSLTIPSAQLSAVHALARDSGATLFMTLLAALAVLLERYTGQRDIVVGSPIANRQDTRLEALIGFFVNTLAMRVQVNPGMSFRALLADVRAMTLDAYAHQDLPFERLVEELAPERRLNQTPICQVVFALQNAPQGPQHLPGLVIEPVVDDGLQVRFDLELHAVERAGGVELYWVYKHELFDRWRIEQMARHFAQLVQAVAAAPDEPVQVIQWLLGGERDRVLAEFNATERLLPRATLASLFEAQSASHPAKTAVVFEGTSLSYRELNARANLLAHQLITRGVRPDDRVGLCLERSSEVVIAILAIVKAGAAYVPIATDPPAMRRDALCADADLRVVITSETSRAWFADRIDVVIVDGSTDGAAADPAADANPAIVVSPLTAAYVSYTSGSTGRPKGVVVPQAAIVRLVLNTNYVDLDGSTRTLQFAPLSFDAATFEIWAALLNGGSLIVAPPGPLAIEEIGALIERHAVNTLWLTAGLFAEVVEHALPSLAPVRQLLAGGDVLPVEAVDRVRHAYPHCQVINGYGPTENTTFSCCYRIPATDDLRSGVAIGSPIANSRAYVLDSRLSPVAVGVRGELYVAGEGLARGYLRRAAQTAERFVADPHASTPGARMYRTGDLARWRPDGTLEFLGRADTQLKIRGFRVEPGEIEAVLLTHPRVHQALVTIDDRGSDKRLLAYVIPRPGETDHGEEQRTHVEEWQQLYDATYGDRDGGGGEGDFDTTGWRSSYTGAAIPAEEMRLWVDETVRRVRALTPTRVLEIGCGTGLLLTRLAGACDAYLGIDFSAPVLAQLDRYLTTRPDLAHVELRQAMAHELAFVADDSVDTVVLNSIVQYFPDVEYLIDVIAESVRVTRPGGHIFVGDVRSLPLLDAFHTSVALHKAGDDESVADLRTRVAQAVRQEKELVLDPMLFTQLPDRLPSLGRIEVMPKAGGYDNEISRFRYDVILYVGPRQRVVEPDEWVIWDAAGEWRALANAALAATPNVGVRAVRDARVSADVAALRLLDARAVSDIGELRAVSGDPDGEDPSAVMSWAAALGRSLLWHGFTRDGTFDVIVGPRWMNDDRPGESPPTFDVRRYANAPARVTRDADLGAELHPYLRQRLPDYMVPSVVIAIESWPLTPNGKIDRAALPGPEPVAASDTVPRTAEQQVLCALFAEVLGVPRVGTDDNFFALGGHSLMAARLVSRVRARLGVELSVRTLFESPTVAELAARLTDRATAHNALARVLPIRQQGTRPPLFCLPPGGGLSWGYAGLLTAISPDRPVYGLQAGGIESEEPLPATIDVIAADYARLIRNIQPRGPYHLLGWSFGGLVAHAVACLLREGGAAVTLLALLDSYPMVDVGELAVLDDDEALRDLAEVVGLDFADWRGRLPTIDAIVDRARVTGHALGTIDTAQARRMLAVGRHSAMLIPGYRPRRFDGDMLLFAAAEDPSPFARADAWDDYVAGRIERHTVACRHARMTDPEPLAAIARTIEAYLDRAAASRPGRFAASTPVRSPITGESHDQPIRG